MRKALVGCLLLAILVAPSLAAENTYSLGVGVAGSRTEVDKGAEIDAMGGFTAFRFNARHGAILLFSLSATEGEDTANIDIGTTTVGAKVDDSFLHAAMTAGFMFRRDSVFRYFFHAGFAYLDVQEKIDGEDSVNDSSFALSVGGGIEVGRGKHAGYLNVGYDYDHDVDYVVPSSLGNIGSRSGFNMLEIQVGYIYNF